VQRRTDEWELLAFALIRVYEHTIIITTSEPRSKKVICHGDTEAQREGKQKELRKD
jgi:hypothetical protein